MNPNGQSPLLIALPQNLWNKRKSFGIKTTKIMPTPLSASPKTPKSAKP
jgi:hypothetical protein